MGFASATLSAAPVPWKLPAYTMVARDMDLRDALDTFAVAEGLSVVMSQSVMGVFSGDFKDVPPSEFLDKIATTHNLIWYYDGAALYLYGAGEISTMLIDLQYMKAGEVRAMLSELGVEDARYPLKTTSKDELVMVSGPPRYVALVAEMISKADSLKEKRTLSEVETRLFPLVYTWADDVSFKVNSPESTLTIHGVARLLEQIMSSTSSTGTQDASLTNEVSALDSKLNSAIRPVIRAENRLNAVLVRDVSSRMPMYEKLIRELDVPQQLIEIEVTAVELSRQDALDWQLSLSLATSHGHSEYGIGQNAGNIFSPSDVAGQGLAGSLTHIHSSYSLAASLSALRQKGKARSISKTSLVTVNNLAAEMTDTQSYHAKVVGTEVATLEEVSAGTKLQIKPRILKSASAEVPNQVWLSLSLDDGGFESISVDAMPMTRSSTLQTQTAIYENESVMLAGYLRDIDQDAGWGIPYLRDIPFIGWLFGGTSTRRETVQRMFILTPHILSIDTEMLVREQGTRLRDITTGESLEDDAEASDEERALREVERKDTRARRSEMTRDAIARRKAELSHAKEMRQFDRKRQERRLDEDMRGWKAEEHEAKTELEAEEDAAKAKHAAEVKAAKEKKEAEELAAKEKKAAEEKARLEAEEKAKREAEEKRIAEENARKEAEAKAKQAEEERRAAEAKAKQEAEAKRAAEEQARMAAEEKRIADEKAQKEAEAKRVADEKAQKEAEAKRAADEKAKAEAALKAKKAAEAKRAAEAKAKKAAAAKQAPGAKAKPSTDAKAKPSTDARAKHATEAKAKNDAEAKAKMEADAKAQKERAAKAKLDAETKPVLPAPKPEGRIEIK